ncbi:response regulator transcription factor [Streptomyces spectabilis]|uniref:response regulator transcription factor n=1 Tax=Streptomyces spectabilis TaxID=68270 RepID=UPI003F4D06C6
MMNGRSNVTDLVREPRDRPLRSLSSAVAGARALSATWQVLVVGSDSPDRDRLTRDLERHGHDVRQAATGAEALAAHGEADVILLDFDLPDLDGLQVCRMIRAAANTPVIAVTGRGSELDTVLGLQAGADDYVAKPYGFRELLARIEAVMRRFEPRAETARVIEHGPLRIDVNSREVHFHHRRVPLTRKEFDLLHMLAAHPGTVVSRRVIVRQIWGDSWSRRTVDTHVSSLRGKLGDSDWIVNVRGVGFMMAEA